MLVGTVLIQGHITTKITQSSWLHRVKVIRWRLHKVTQSQGYEVKVTRISRLHTNQGYTGSRLEGEGYTKIKVTQSQGFNLGEG